MKQALCALTAVAAALSFSTTASAAKYYNCATNSGCAASGDIRVTANYAQTRYPIVLAHGLAGFTKVGPVDYFYGIPQDLTAQGSQVYVTLTSSVASSGEMRGEQLLAQVRNIVAITGKGKVNLIGHSQGGLDSRYVAGVSPNLVASITSVGTPHKGTPVADIALKVIQGEPTGLLNSAASALVSGVGQLITGVSGGGSSDQSLSGTLTTLSTAGAASFNQRFPAGVPTSACGTGATQSQGITFYSWGGSQPLTNVLDPLELVFTASSLGFFGESSDGVVGRCSNHFGQVLRDNYGMNHGDLINQVFGLTNLFETDPKSVYRQQANRLKNASL
ncbi:MAG: lipase family alpha/beta hydrolase [Flavobacteriales bacterium]